jgi:5'-nucleotidase
MRIVITNDDGIEAKGIKALTAALSDIGDIYVVAPWEQQSAGSHSTTLHKPLRADEFPLNVGEKKAFRVSGTPADCVLLAVDVLVKGKIDLVVSGINQGPNLGDDVIYSGTVAGAREGALNGIVSIAFSIDGFENPHYESAAQFAKIFVKKVINEKIRGEIYFNVNVPNLPWKDIKGVKIVKQGKRRYIDRVMIGKDPFGKIYYWIGGKPVDSENNETDNGVVHKGFISVTHMKVDMTDYSIMDIVKKWDITLNK